VAAGDPPATQSENIMKRDLFGLAVAAMLALGLAGCGGGGGGGSGLASTPTPTSPPPPPPPASAAVDIFPSPATQEFAAIGIGNDLRIRYDAATNRYEVMAEGRAWEALRDDPLSSPTPGNPNTNFVFAGAAVNHSFFLIRAHYSYPDQTDRRYQYSNLAAWGRTEGSVGLGGYVAFGMATPAGSVPITGSASYEGFIEGVATVQYPYEGVPALAHVDGTVTMNFNFGAGTLSGHIDPDIVTDRSYDLGTLTFANTVFGTGSRSYSGQFATSVSGPNTFSGLFTGPGAQELIGKWTFPFTSPIDGATASATGAWIAKKQ
jgi:hypothetical protein